MTKKRIKCSKCENTAIVFPIFRYGKYGFDFGSKQYCGDCWQKYRNYFKQFLKYGLKLAILPDGMKYGDRYKFIQKIRNPTCLKSKELKIVEWGDFV